MPAVVVRQRKAWRRKDGVFIYFEDNGGVIVNNKGEMKGELVGADLDGLAATLFFVRTDSSRPVCAQNMERAVAAKPPPCFFFSGTGRRERGGHRKHFYFVVMSTRELPRRCAHRSLHACSDLYPLLSPSVVVFFALGCVLRRLRFRHQRPRGQGVRRPVAPYRQQRRLHRLSFFADEDMKKEFGCRNPTRSSQVPQDRSLAPF